MRACLCCELKYLKHNNEFLEGENYTILLRVQAEVWPDSPLQREWGKAVAYT